MAGAACASLRPPVTAQLRWTRILVAGGDPLDDLHRVQGGRSGDHLDRPDLAGAPVSDPQPVPPPRGSPPPRWEPAAHHPPSRRPRPPPWPTFPGAAACAAPPSRLPGRSRPRRTAGCSSTRRRAAACEETRATSPRSTMPGKASPVTVAGWPGRTRVTSTSSTWPTTANPSRSPMVRRRSPCSTDVPFASLRLASPAAPSPFSPGCMTTPVGGRDHRRPAQGVLDAGKAGARILELQPCHPRAPPYPGPAPPGGRAPPTPGRATGYGAPSRRRRAPTPGMRPRSRRKAVSESRVLRASSASRVLVSTRRARDTSA